MQRTRFLLMAGGKGTRLWPKSSRQRPKQFVKLVENESLLQASYARLKGITTQADIFVVTGEEFSQLVLTQVPELPLSNLILEPVLKDTAACLAMSIPYLCLGQEQSDPIVVALPVDAHIPDSDSFRACIEMAVLQARETRRVIVFGVRPTRPETGFGYICTGEKLGESVFRVKKFTEKPDFATAKIFVTDPSYYWNSGIFVAPSSTLKRLFEQHLPKHYWAMSNLACRLGSRHEASAKRHVYSMLDRLSIDYGLMEKTTDILMIEANFAWDDLGTWGSLARTQDSDPQDGNIIFGNCEVMESKNCIVDSGGKLVTLIGVDDLIIVNSENVVLICDRKREQDIKQLYEKLRIKGFDSIL